MNDKTPLTMKDIARELGISVATVSRALKDSPRISPERRAAIQQYAREHDFTPNVLAESLRHSRVQPVKLIGVIVPEFTHFYFSSILAGIEEEASSRGYRIMVAQSNEQYEREVRICQSFYENKVCGIIVSQAKDTKRYDHFERLMDAGVPLVFYDRICTGVNASRVVVDDYMGAYNAVSHLIETGCTRIAFYGSAPTLEISKNRFNGYKDALLKNGLHYDESLTRICDNRADAEMITPELLKTDAPPQRLFCRQRRYGDRHSVYCQAHGIPSTGGRLNLWIHKWTAGYSLRPNADYRGAAWCESWRGGSRYTDRPSGRKNTTRQDRATNSSYKAGCPWNNTITKIKNISGI